MCGRVRGRQSMLLSLGIQTLATGAVASVDQLGELNHVAGARWGLVLSLVVAQGLDDIGDWAGV